MTEDVSETMQQIIDHFRPYLNGHGSVAFYTAVAVKLNDADGSAAWTWRYVQGVAAGTVPPSRRFAAAVQVLAASLDGLPVVIARAERVEVLAEPGALAAGAYVMGAARPCARPGCPVVFVPNVPWRRLCPICSPIKSKIENRNSKIFVVAQGGDGEPSAVGEQDQEEVFGYHGASSFRCLLSNSIITRSALAASPRYLAWSAHRPRLAVSAGSLARASALAAKYRARHWQWAMASAGGMARS